VAAAQQRLRGLLDVQPSHAGLHLIGWLAEGIDARQACRAAFHQGVDVLSLSAYALTPQARSGLVLGYACANPQAIRAAVDRLALALEKVHATGL
jgi:GntR family transcriptional regulator/MocR family aminotransferase